MTTARVATTKVHAMNHVTNPTKPDNMERTQAEYHVDTTCAGNNMKVLS